MTAKLTSIAFAASLGAAIFSIASLGSAPLGVPFSVPLGVSEAVAQSPQGNQRRFEKCQRLKDAGQWNWSGIATGSSYGYGGFNGRTGFHVRSCHANRASCERWVDNIYYEIVRIDTLRSVRCVPRRR